MTERYVLGLEELDRTQVALAGGKGANLGELTRIEGVAVPAGFCVTTDAYRQVIAPLINDRASSARIRAVIEGAAIPDDLAAAIADAVATAGGERAAYAVRSSATAEDLPTASFAGQQDTFLNVVGLPAILRHISRCWASLFTERAVTYRLRNGVDHRQVQMAVIVQRMVDARAAGIMFTADPVTSNRTIVAIEAVAGLGDALAEGRATPDRYQVRDGEVIAAAGQTLSDADVRQLAGLGRRIEAHFGQPQDIEWCLADETDDGFQIVQSRPITTLFPVPVTDDHENHVYVSVGHQQMMTDAMKPLGLALWQLTTRRPMAEAGGRLFVDVTRQLSSPALRKGLVATFERHNPLMGAALRSTLDRDFIPLRPDADPPATPAAPTPPAPLETDPAIVTELVERGQAALARLKAEIATKTGTELIDFIVADVRDLQQVMFAPRSTQAIMAGMNASRWLNEHAEEWLGEKDVVDTLTQSVPGNVTSEMGLALLNVADAIRPHPDVVRYLEQADDGFIGKLPELDGGLEARDAVLGFLDSYGMRCVGEIDVTRPRWSERPAQLLPLILGNVRNFAPGAAERRFADGLRNARDKEQELLARLRTLPDGDRKADEAKAMIDRLRTFTGYREYPKYHMICRYFVYKQALLNDPALLGEDIFYLRFPELRAVADTGEVDHQLIHHRYDEFRSYQALRPPRVLTSDGEAVEGSYGRGDVPAGALAGLPVSAGMVEGRARVVLDLNEADFDEGDILVTAYTDPSWTPAFVAIAGLVTEVGGLMTHGAVIAREYGLPAVVGVEHATELIHDGQRIRVHGTEGYVEILR